MILLEKNIRLRNGYQISLRSPLASDAETLLKHLRLVFPESYRNLNHPAHHFDSFPIEKEARILEDFSKSKERFMLSAFDGNRIIGNLGLLGLGGEFLKFSARLGMAIEKPFHGMGLGSEMIGFALESARNIGLHRVELTVRTFNEAGIRLYEKSGFQRVGLLKDVAFIDGQFCDEYIYQILL